MAHLLAACLQAASVGRAGNPSPSDRPLLVRQIGRGALGAPLKVGHPATARSGPHPKLEPRNHIDLKPFSNGL